MMAGGGWDMGYWGGYYGGVGLSLEEMEEIDVVQDGNISIYPYPEGESPYYYTEEHLVEFSKKSIQKLNQDAGKRYEFVKLDEALMFRSFDGVDTIRAYFKASQPPHGIVHNFEATIYCPRDDVTFLSNPPNLQTISVSPFPDSDSHTSDDSPAQHLEAQVQLLKV